MKKNYKTILAMVILLISTPSFSLGFTGWTTVEQIRQGQGGSPIILVASIGDAATTCPKSGWLRFEDADSPVGKRHFSTLLAALTSQKEVNIRTSKCSADYPYINEVRVKN